MTCEELLQALNNYVDGDIDPEMCETFAAHLAGCNPCQVVVDNIRQTIMLFKAGQRFELPQVFQATLTSQLRSRWQAKFGN